MTEEYCQNKTDHKIENAPPVLPEAAALSNLTQRKLRDEGRENRDCNLQSSKRSEHFRENK